MSMIEINPPAQHDFCQLVSLLAAYLDQHPDGADRLKEYMAGPGLWDTTDVIEYTGWGRTYIQRLVTSGVLPYIPGKRQESTGAVTDRRRLWPS
jgi:hypothetical protein